MTTLNDFREQDTIDLDWWNKPKTTLPSTLFSAYDRITEQDRSRVRDGVCYGRAYSGVRHEVTGYGMTSGLLTNNQGQVAVPFVTLNVIKSVVDTCTSKIAGGEVRPFFLTQGGDWSLQQRAKRLNKFALGLLHATKMRELGPQVFRDGCVFGTGVLKVIEDPTQPGRILAERVFPLELAVDEQEAEHGDPRTLYQIKQVNRFVLARQFPGARSAIAHAPRAEPRPGITYATADQVEVVEAWHLPSGPDAGDGRHTVSIRSECLFAEEWTRDRFPFAWFRWSKRLLGFWGLGISEGLSGTQLEMNKTLRRIQESLAVAAVPRVFLPVGSQVVKSHLNNQVGSIIEYLGDKPPVIHEGAGVPPALLEHLNYLFQKAFEIEGVSQLSAASKKPAGVIAAEAIREISDNETERFVTPGKAYEDFVLDAVELGLDLIREIAERPPEKDDKEDSKKRKAAPLQVMVPGRRKLELVKWKDVDLSRNAYQIQAWPTNLLPSSPAGKLQTVQELTQAGWLRPDQAQGLLDFPDLEGATSLATARYDNILRTVEMILDEGKYRAPDPYQALALGVETMNQVYLKAWDDGAPEDRLELLRLWMQEASALLQQAQPPAPAAGLPGAPGGAAPPGAPTARPAAPPTSDLLPSMPTQGAA